MADQAAYSRIYDLKTAGVDKVLADVNAVIARLEVLGKVKNDVVGSTSSTDTGAAGYEKLSASMDKLTASFEDFAIVQKNVTASMQQGAQALGSNLTAATVGVGKMQAAIVNVQKTAFDYNETLLTLGGRLAQLRGDLQGVDSGISELNKRFESSFPAIKTYEDRMEKLNQRLSDGKITQLDYEKAVAQANTALEKASIGAAEYNAEMEQLVALQSKIKTEIAETSGAMNTMNKVNNPALTDEETAALAANKVQLQQRTAMLKLQAQAEDALAGSTKDARVQITLLNREQENLVVTRTKDVQLTDEEIAANVARRDAIIAEKNALHDFVATNADKNLARVLNIGNYPTATAEFAALKQQMQQLILSGEAEGAEFKKLEARALELSAAIKEVGVATTTTASTGEKFGNIVEKMGLRMIANLIIFQAAIEVAQYLWEAWTKDSKAAEELRQKMIDLDTTASVNAYREMSELKVLNSIAIDHNETMAIRLRAVDDMQEKYPDYLGNISKEKILIGDTADAMERLNEALMNKAVYDAAEGKIAELGKQYFDLNHELKELARQESKDLEHAQSVQGRDLIVRNYEVERNKTQAKIDELKKQMDLFQKEAEEFAAKAPGLVLGKPGKEKDHTQQNINEWLRQQKELNDYMNKLHADALKEESEFNKSMEDWRKQILATIAAADTAELDKNKAHLAEIQSDQQAALDAQLLALSESYAKKEIDDEEYAKRKKEIQSQSNREILSETIKYLEAEIQAAKVSDEAKKAMLKELADYKHKMNQQIIADNERADKKEVLDTKLIYSTLVDILSEYANNEIKILDKKSAHRQELMKQGLEWNKKVIDSEAQSNQQRLANDKAFALAQSELAKNKAKEDKRRAEAQEIINFVVATGNLLASNKDWSIPGLVALAVKEGLIAAKFAVMESQLASAPAYAQGTGTGSHPGGMAWVGDGGEPELVKVGSRYSITPSTPTLTNLPAGATVTPFSQISNLGSGLQAPRFTSTSTGGGGDNSAAFAEIHGALRTIAAGMANQRIVYEPHKAVKANNNAYYSTIKA